VADLTAQRTLVKSPPELWSELSEVESLAKHLGELGEIRITKVEPETTVAWEGEDVSGTVEIEQSGWGTKVTFKATVPEPGPTDVGEPPGPEPEPVAAVAEPGPEPVAEPDPMEDPEPVAVAEPKPVAAADPDPAPRRQSFLARWLFRRRGPEPEPAVTVVEPDEPEPEPVAAPDAERATPDPVPVAVADPAPVAPAPDPAPAPPPVPLKPEPAPEPPPAAADADRVQRVLDDTLDALGQAHHRPFSRG
jgi:hypothetical protein